jgi:hypothetical protein
MFNIEFIIKAIALVVAIGLLLTSVDFSYLLAKFFVKDSKEDTKVDDIETVTNESAVFLKTLELWYLLKKKCDDSKLTTASKKLDEVFPLLNDNLENK